MKEADHEGHLKRSHRYKNKYSLVSNLFPIHIQHIINTANKM